MGAMEKRDELLRVLKLYGIRQNAFARMVGVTPRAVNLWARGQRATPEPVMAYLRVLGMLPKAERAQEILYGGIDE